MADEPNKEITAVTIEGQELVGEGVKALYELVSLMADDKCEFCVSVEDLQYEYLVQSTLCDDCRDLFTHWLKLNTRRFKLSFNEDIVKMREARETLRNLPEVRILRESLNKDK